ncbi:MAG: hypothetical protein F6K36_28535 [Symploca sp. SIO3C6]|nr:hypothetical protein [Symploca sp. SIO3C6]
MTWKQIAGIYTSKEWQFTQQVTGTLFRVKHQISPQDFLTNPNRFRFGHLPHGFHGYIGQGTLETSTPELFQIQRLYPRPQFDLIELRLPIKLNSRRLAVRGQTKYYQSLSWIVYLEVWQGVTIPKGDAFSFTLNNGVVYANGEASAFTDTVFEIESTGIGSQDFEVGGFYEIETSRKIGDPFIQRSGVDGLIFTFTSLRRIPDNSIKVYLLAS